MPIAFGLRGKTASLSLPLILKAPVGWGIGRLIRLAMLRNEYRAYSRLPEMQGIPRCYGLLDGHYLVLEYIDGVPIRRAQITDRSIFFKTLLKVIKELHKAGVAHTDLKKGQPSCCNMMPSMKM